MKNSVIWTLVLVMMAGCATPPSPIARREVAALTPEVPGQIVQDEEVETEDIESFRISDPEGPKIVNEELLRIPTEVNPQVEKWISYFNGRGRGHMERYLARSTRYEKLMKKVLRDNGLPEDLFYIALIESGFSSGATSHASAVGYWQFIRGTGKRYGLQIDRFVDERRDPVLATQAAAEYFKGLYSIFGSWYLAMASYNVGENRVKKEVVRNNTQDFWELHRLRRLPRETLEYVPKFIAAKLIAENRSKYGFEDLDFLPPIEFDHIYIDKPVNMRVMAEKMNINYEDFKALNPKYKGEVAPLEEQTLSLRVPPGSQEVAMLAASNSVVENIQFIADGGDTQSYRVRRGDSLGTIARKFRTSIAFLRDLNDLPRRKKLRPGMVVQVPDRTPISTKRAVVSRAVEKRPRLVRKKLNSRIYIVQSGDSLTSIAAKYSTNIPTLLKLNKIKKGSSLKTGTKVRLPASEKREGNRKNSSMKPLPQTSKIHVVRSGENLVRIAAKYNVSVEDLRLRNRSRAGGKLFIGSRLLIPLAEARQE